MKPSTDTLPSHGEMCFACGRQLSFGPMPIKAHWARTGDGQNVLVGPECARRITADGYQPPLGGPRLYPVLS